MQRPHFLHTALIVPALLLASPGMAQEPNPSDPTWIITGDRTLTVDKAFKLTETPATVDIPISTDKITYDMIPRRPAVSIDVAPLQPSRIKVREPLEPLYKGFVKAGVGTYLSPLLEAYYTSTRSRDLAWGAHVRHLSANAGIGGPVAFSGFSQNSAEAWAKKVLNKHTLQTTARWERNVWHYYGFDREGLQELRRPVLEDPNYEIEKKDYRQRFNTLALENKWKSYYADSSRINHDLNLNLYHLGDRYDAREIGVAAFGNLRTYREGQLYDAKVGIDLVSYRADTLKAFAFTYAPVDTFSTPIPATDRDNVIIYAVPRIVQHLGKLTFMGGLGLYGQFSNQARFHAFPDIEVSYSLFDNIFVPYAAITGSVERTSFRTLTPQNPWMLSNQNIENAVVKYNVYGGIRGSFSDRVSFNIGLGYDETENRALFVNDVNLSRQNRFAAIFDEVQTLTLHGELTFQNHEKWSTVVRLETYSYNTVLEDKPWHLPAYRFMVNGHYNLYNKLELGTQLHLIGNRDVKVLPGPADSFQPSADATLTDNGYYLVELKPYFDMSLTALYRYTPRLSGFVEAHNLTATRYDIFYRMPAQRAFIIGGVKYAF
jgi:hypothetical protein